jgi:hypothetical protein
MYNLDWADWLINWHLPEPMSCIPHAKASKRHNNPLDLRGLAA